MIRRIALFLVIIFLSIIQVNAQKYQKPITLHDLDSLYQKFKKYYLQSDTSATLKYARAYFNSSLDIKDTNHIARGYYLRIISNQKSSRNDLYDSIIALKSGLKENDILTTAYYDLGVHRYNKFRYSEALTYYIKAKESNYGNKKEYFDFKINIDIAALKIRIEENQEAFDLLQKSWKEALKNNYEKKYPDDYISTILSLADVCRKLQKIDSAQSYINLGLEKSKEKNKTQYYRFQLLQGITRLSNYYTPDIFHTMEQAIHYLNSNNHTTLIDENINISLAYYHIGKSHIKNDKPDKAMHYFHKVDSIIGNNATILPETLESYTYLKNYYGDKGDIQKQLKYLTKLLSFKDSLESQYKFINNEIKEKYDFPLLLEEEKKIIYRYEKGYQKFSILIYVLSIVGFLIFCFYIYQWVQKNKYKNRYENLKGQNISKINKKKTLASIEKPNLPDEVFNKVIICLEAFEEKKLFS